MAELLLSKGAGLEAKDKNGPGSQGRAQCEVGNVSCYNSRGNTKAY